MSVALHSWLDLTAYQTLRARRLAWERNATEKLNLLRRLAHEHIYRDLPETRMEQSFNEQLFAKVLGYRTLFSHDAMPYHLLPKNFSGGKNYDDFSLGFFGSGSNKVLGSAELKGSEANLDKRQTSGAYNGRTPVEQALATATGHGSGCRWALVSNMRELRLYAVGSPETPLAVADLTAVRNPHDLASLCAHFDRQALLGDEKMPGDMVIALDPEHPSAPIDPAENGYRVVFRFTPKEPNQLALFEIEQGLREAIYKVRPQAHRYLGGLTDEAYQNAEGTPRLRAKARDGWVAIDGANAEMAGRLATSRFGDVLVSVRLPHLRVSGRKDERVRLFPSMGDQAVLRG